VRSHRKDQAYLPSYFHFWIFRALTCFDTAECGLFVPALLNSSGLDYNVFGCGELVGGDYESLKMGIGSFAFLCHCT